MVGHYDLKEIQIIFTASRVDLYRTQRVYVEILYHTHIYSYKWLLIKTYNSLTGALA